MGGSSTKCKILCNVNPEHFKDYIFTKEVRIVTLVKEIRILCVSL